MYAGVIFKKNYIFHSYFLSKVMFVPISLFKKQIWNHLDHFKNLDHLVIVFYLRWKNNHTCLNVWVAQLPGKKKMLFINQGITLTRFIFFGMKKTRAGVVLVTFFVIHLLTHMHSVAAKFPNLTKSNRLILTWPKTS